MPSLRSTTSAAIAAGLFGQSALIASGVLAARALGVEDRGYLALLVLFPAVISSVVGAGVPQAVIFFMAGGHYSRRLIAALVWKILGFQALVILGLHLIVAFMYVENRPAIVQMAVYFSLPIGPLTLTQEYCFALLQGQRRFGFLTAARLFLPAVYAAVVLAAFVADVADLVVLVICWVFALAVSAIASLAAAAHGVRMSEEPGRKSPELKDLAKFGLNGLIGAMSPIETFRLDQLLGGLVLSPTALGLYVVGRAFANIPVFIASSAITVAYPSVAGSRSIDDAMRVSWRYFWGVTLCNLVVVLPLILALPIFLPLLFGSAFGEAIILGQILLVATTIYASCRVLCEGLRGLGAPTVSTYVELSMYPWLLVGLPFLALRWGPVGLAISALVGHAIALCIALVLGRHALARVRRSEPKSQEI